MYAEDIHGQHDLLCGFSTDVSFVFRFDNNPPADMFTILNYLINEVMLV